MVGIPPLRRPREIDRAASARASANASTRFRRINVQRSTIVGTPNSRVGPILRSVGFILRTVAMFDVTTTDRYRYHGRGTRKSRIDRDLVNDARVICDRRANRPAATDLDRASRLFLMTKPDPPENPGRAFFTASPELRDVADAGSKKRVFKA